MSSEIPEEFLPFLSVQWTIIWPITSLLVAYFVYGFYILLFGTCVYMMRRRQQDNESLNSNLYLLLAITLFGLSTAFIIVYTIKQANDSIVFFTTLKTGDYQLLLDYRDSDIKKTVLTSFIQLLPILLNIAADYMLAHRCYHIWGSKKRVAFPLIVILVLTNGVGVISAILLIIGVSDASNESYDALYSAGETGNAAYSIASIIVNSLLTLSTAGRIWWIHRQVRAHGIHTSDNFVQSVSRIIFESGLLYPMLSTVGLILNNIPILEMVPFDPYPTITLSAGIAPTLILVRAKFGKNIESLQPQLSDICFTGRQPTRKSSDTAAQVGSLGNLSTGRVDGERWDEQRIADGKEIP